MHGRLGCRVIPREAEGRMAYGLELFDAEKRRNLIFRCREPIMGIDYLEHGHVTGSAEVNPILKGDYRSADDCK